MNNSNFETKGEPKGMIRSLVACPEPMRTDFVMRRNLEQTELEKSISENNLVWIDIVDPDDDEIDWLEEQFHLSPAVVEDIQRADRRPALMVYPDYLFLSLFEPHIVRDRVEGREIHCLITDTCFITVRTGDTDSVDAAYDRVAISPDAWRSGIAYCFYLTAQNVTDTYYPLLDRVSNQLNTLEEKLLTSGIEEQTRRRIYRMKQQLIELRQMVAPQREVFSNVIGEKRLTKSAAHTRFIPTSV